MHKLIAFFAILAVSTAAPGPHGIIAYSSPVVSPVITSVVSPAVTSYSSYSSSVVHGSPVVPIHQAVVHQPLVHAVPVAYPAHVPVWV